MEIISMNTLLKLTLNEATELAIKSSVAIRDSTSCVGLSNICYTPSNKFL